MKMYNNGQRKSMMYGGGASMRKPMMYGGMTKKKMNMGGLADQNRKTTTGSSAMMNPMGSMTEKKKFSMGMSYGGDAKKKSEDFGMLSVKAGVDNNPNATRADAIAGATKKKKKMTMAT